MAPPGPPWLRASLATLALLLAAGCAGPGPGGPTATGTPTGPQETAAPETLAFEACRELHTFFDAPAAGFEALLPPNFTAAPGRAPGTAQVAVFAWTCGAAMEMWALLEVVPPPALRNGTVQLEGLVLEAFTPNATHAGLYRSWGVERIHHATVTTLESFDAAAAEHFRLVLGDDAMTYTVVTDVVDQPGAFDSQSYRFWAGNATSLAGHVESLHGPGASVGAGTARFEQEGDPAAPPVATGIGHRVDGATVRHRFVPA
jgi:hypothetical protein